VSEKDYRIEKDSMGELKVPKECHWGPQTQRAVENFQISHIKMPSGFIRSAHKHKELLKISRSVILKCLLDLFVL